MLHGTHFQVENEEELPEDKIWGPYLWYFNDGSISDANRRLKKSNIIGHTSGSIIRSFQAEVL